MENPDLIIKKPTAVQKLLGNPTWTSTVVKGKDQTAKFIFTKKDGDKTITLETKFFRSKIWKKCLEEAPKKAEDNCHLAEDYQVEIMDSLYQCDQFLSLNHKDGNRIKGRTKHVEVKISHRDEVRIKGFKRHKKHTSFNDGIYTVVEIPLNWTGRTTIYHRGINFTIQRK